MDIESPREVSRALVRESLIAISNLLPDNVATEDGSPPESFGSGNAVASNGENADKYRSELISISYEDSPDAKPQPVANHGKY